MYIRKGNLIYTSEPSSLYPIQNILSRSAMEMVSAAEARGSMLHPDLKVLDVPPPIITPVFDSFAVLDGHTRCCEATRKNLGIDAYIVEHEKEIWELPAHAFHRISREWACRNLREVNNYLTHTLRQVPTIQHLVDKEYKNFTEPSEQIKNIFRSDFRSSGSSL